MSKSSYPLRRWLKSMTTFSEIQEEKKHAKEQYEMDYKAQEESKGSVHVTGRTMLVDSVISLPVGFSLSLLPSDHAARFAQDYSNAPSKPSVGESNHRSGKSMEHESGISNGGHRINASDASVWESICRFFKVGAVLSREKHNRRNKDTSILSEYKSKS
jgi:hypothetical protein